MSRAVSNVNVVDRFCLMTRTVNQIEFLIPSQACTRVSNLDCTLPLHDPQAIVAAREPNASVKLATVVLWEYGRVVSSAAVRVQPLITASCLAWGQ